MQIKKEQKNELIKDLRKQYYLAICNGEKRKARYVVDWALEFGLEPLEIYLEIFTPTQAEMGNDWLKGKLTVCEEHRATQITSDEMTRLREQIKVKRSLGRKVVVTTLTGDLHILGARMVADFFYEDGWDVDYLGPNTPADEVEKHLEKEQAEVLVLSVSNPEHLTEVIKLASRLKKISKPPFIILGGSAVNKSKLKKDDYSVDLISLTPEKAIQGARKYCDISGSKKSLEQLLETVGERIQQGRIGKGMSQKELATKASLDRTYLSLLENGKKNITLGALLRLSEALDTEIVEMLK